jgi:hypothetical protein
VPDVAFEFHPGLQHLLPAQPEDLATGEAAHQGESDIGSVHVSGSFSGNNQEAQRGHGTRVFI